MKADIVVDVGNSRIKWGRCENGRVTKMARLSPGDPVAWQRQAEQWGLSPALRWVIAGVNPAPLVDLQKWLDNNGNASWLLDDCKKLPLRTSLAHPEKAGIDRLLNAVAVWEKQQGPSIIVDAGSAVTVDYVDENCVFQGGAIFPGLRLMAKALNDYTAQLPLVEVEKPLPSPAGCDTIEAVESGLLWSVCGGIATLIERTRQMNRNSPTVYLTGGDGARLSKALIELDSSGHQVWPEMTLEGIRITAERQPETDSPTNPSPPLAAVEAIRD